MGPLGVGTFSTNITSGMTPGVTYYYRCVGINAAGEGWATDYEPFTTATPPSENLIVNHTFETDGDTPEEATYWTVRGGFEDLVTRTKAVPRTGSYSLSFEDGGPTDIYGLYVFGEGLNLFRVTWNGQYAGGGVHPAGGIRPGYVFSGSAYTRARIAGVSPVEFKYALFNTSESSDWMVGSNEHNNVVYESITASNSYPMAVSNVSDNVAPALSRMEDSPGLYHGDDLTLYATHPRLELNPTPTNPVAFPVTPDGMTSEMTVQARTRTGSANTVLYGAYSTNSADMTRTDWTLKAWEEIHDPDDVFQIVSGQNLANTNNTDWSDMTVRFNPLAISATHTGVLRIATTDPNDWYAGGGKLLNSIVFEEYILTATSAPSLTISIDDVMVVETDSVTTNAVFTISLSSTAPQNVSVSYTTTDDTATSGEGDYVSKNGTATVTAGQTSTTVSVVVNPDNDNEGDEIFHLDLSNIQPSGQSIAFAGGDSRGTCTIDDDDDTINGTVFRMK